MALDETKTFFSSSFNYQKIATRGTGSVSVPNGTPFTAVTITHNLGYIPSARVWYDIGTGRFPATTEQFVDLVSFTSANNFCLARYYFTTTTLVIEFQNQSGSTKTFNYWYRIYYDE